MSSDAILGNSGIVQNRCSIGKNLTYSYDKTTKRYTIKTPKGTTISCPRQASMNKASIYFISNDKSELIRLENISDATIVSSKSVFSQINLAGCNRCNIDASRNNNSDEINLYDSERFHSKNNTVIIDKNDNLYIDTPTGEARISSSGKYSENTVKEERKDFWHRIFGYSKAK